MRRPCLITLITTFIACLNCFVKYWLGFTTMYINVTYIIGAGSLRLRKFCNPRNKFHASPSFRLRSDNKKMSFPPSSVLILRQAKRKTFTKCLHESHIKNFFFSRIVDFYNVRKSQYKSAKLKMQLWDNRKIY